MGLTWCDRFAFRYDARFRAALQAAGLGPDRSGVAVGDDMIVARFGPFVAETSLTNVAHAAVTGPYRWWRAVGPRLSLADRGATFGTNAEQGVCIRFREPVRALTPFHHPNLTVTVAEPDALVTAIRRGRASPQR